MERKALSSRSSSRRLSQHQRKMITSVFSMGRWRLVDVVCWRIIFPMVTPTLHKHFLPCPDQACYLLTRNSREACLSSTFVVGLETSRR
ncbi:hypothetical protein M758_8G062100 [Ceratodon purpureus]|nr:hypothetical protein M758_8G062100 [Ceratodon purpureus]